MAMFSDAGGAAVGACQFGGHVGFQLKGEPGASFRHERHTREYAPSVKFYQEAFGWDWQIYFGVENADATVETATAFGAHVIHSAEDSPNSPFGRMATLTDLTGAVFKIAQRPDPAP